MMAVNDVYSDVPEQGAVFTFGKCKFNDNKPGKFWLKDERVEDVVCGDEHTILISEHGKLFTFGENSWGQLGLGHTDAINKPTRVKKLFEYVVIAAAGGKSHTLILTANNLVFGFGCNGDGQVDTTNLDCLKITEPVEIKITNEPVRIKSLSAGADHSAILTESGNVYVWGCCGCLGVETKLPTLLSIEQTIKSISCGYYHTVLLTDGGKVLCYGESEGGKLGLGAVGEEFSNIEEIQFLEEEPIVSVSAGHSHTFLVTESGKLFSFGEGSQGQLGQGTMMMSCDLPQRVLFEQKATHVFCGESHTAILTEDMELFMCGDGRHGKLCFDNLSNYFTFSSPGAFLDMDVLKVACGGCQTIVIAKPTLHKHLNKNAAIRDSECTLSQNEKNNFSKNSEKVDARSYEELGFDSLARSRRRCKKLDTLTLNPLKNTFNFTYKPYSSNKSDLRTLSDDTLQTSTSTVTEIRHQNKPSSPEDSHTVRTSSFKAVNDAGAKEDDRISRINSVSNEDLDEDIEKHFSDSLTTSDIKRKKKKRSSKKIVRNRARPTFEAEIDPAIEENVHKNKKSKEKRSSVSELGDHAPAHPNETQEKTTNQATENDKKSRFCLVL